MQSHTSPHETTTPRTLVLAVAALALTGCTERVEVPVYAPRMQPVIVQAPPAPGDLASLVARHEVAR